ETVRWQPYTELASRIEQTVLDSLIKKYLVVDDAEAGQDFRHRDQVLRDMHWWPPAAIEQYFGRWSNEGVGEDVLTTRVQSAAQFVRDHGPAPPHVTERCNADERVSLPATRRVMLDELLSSRVTCRNFALEAKLDLQSFSDVLMRTFGCQAQVEVYPSVHILK